MSENGKTESYSLKTTAARETVAPDVSYRPPMPEHYRPRIALVGAGGISAAHLEVYRDVGFDVAVICDRTLAKAEARRDEYFPAAEASDDTAKTVTRDDIDVVDLTPHPPERLAIIEAALECGKHVLSEKPFVVDLDEGARLADLADEKGIVLAINQNGRWAPHLAWIREAFRAGLIGELQSCHQGVHWDHSWIQGTPFEAIDDLILYDFGIHRFDFLTSLIGAGATEVFARSHRAAGQAPRPPMLGEALVAFDGGQASIVFDGAARFGPQDRTYVSGNKGTMVSDGPDLNAQSVSLTTEAGIARPALDGTWFREGFIGTMGGLLKAVEDGQPPVNNARDNLPALALAFAAIASARRNTPIRPGDIRSLAEARE